MTWRRSFIRQIPPVDRLLHTQHGMWLKYRGNIHPDRGPACIASAYPDRFVMADTGTGILSDEQIEN